MRVRTGRFGGLRSRGQAALLNARPHGPPMALPRSALPSGLHPCSQTAAPVAWTSEALCLRGPWSIRSLLRSVLRPGTPELLLPLLTSRSPALSAGSPFQAQGEISPGKNAVLHRTAAGFTPPEPWPSRLRGLMPARPARHRLVSGSCPSAHGLRSRLPSHARSPSRSCRSLRSRWPDHGRTCTSKTAPMLGAHKKRPILIEAGVRFRSILVFL